jgi:very-short-patch-repair endonuclease
MSGERTPYPFPFTGEVAERSWFAANNSRVLRFWNNDVRSNLEGVLTILAEALQGEQRP